MERLIRAAAGARRRTSLVAEAARDPECLALLLEAAWDAARSDPAESLRRADLIDAVAEAAEAADTTDAADVAAGARAQAARVRVRGFQALGRFADVVRATEDAAGAARAAGDPLLTATVQIGAVDALGRLDRVGEAFALGNRLVQELLALGAPAEAARVLVNLGILYYRRDEYAAALEAYRRAEGIFAEGGDAVSLARTRLNAAIALTSLNRTGEAVRLYEAARDVFASNGMAVFTATAEANLGFLHYVSGRYALALQLLDRARLAFTQIGDEEGAAQADTDSGDAYRSLNLLPEALACYERASAAFGRLGADDDRARADLGRAAVLAALRRDAEAFAVLEDASAAFRRRRNAVQAAHAGLIRARLLDARGQAGEADAAALRAARAFARAGLSAWATEARWPPADRTLEEAGVGARRMHALARVARREGRGWLECRAQGALGRHYARRGDAARALRHFRAAVDALERARTLIAPEDLHTAFLRDKMAAYEEVVGALLARGGRRHTAEALEYVERAKSRLLLERLLSAVEEMPPPATRAGAEALTRLAELRAELSVSYHRIGYAAENDTARRLGGAGTSAEGDRRAALAALSALEKAYADTARRVEQEAGGDGQTHLALSAVSTAELRGALRPGETLVEFYLVADAVCVFVLDRRGIRALTGIARRDEVTRAARRLRYHLQKAALLPEYRERYARRMEDETRDALHRLHTLLFAPVLPYLAGTEALVVVPHGPLHGLPFHAFHDGTRFLLDRWEFLYAPSAAVWHAGVIAAGRHALPGFASNAPAAKFDSGAGAGGALLMGLPSPGLTRIADEIRELERLLPIASAFLGDGATLERFRAHAGACSRLHLATHALFRADNPLFSGLQFADGWLLARDLYGMRLHCDLATLSACKTGVGQVEAGDELFGLPRGFLAAGARSVAASLWPADDAATTHLMGRFYSHLARGEKAAALRAAQQETREEYPHPYHWAAFVLMGER